MASPLLLHLEVRGFRNLAPQRWSPGAGAHLILGTNGAGKTSLLEAVYLLATTRSFRTHHLADCCAHDEKTFFLAAEIDAGRSVDLELAWSRLEGLRRSLDGKASSLAEHLAVSPVLAWTASDVEMLVGAPSSRRRLLDRGVLGLRPTAIEWLARYRHALRAKRALLQSGTPDPAELAPWNRLLAEAAVEIVARRHHYAELLQSSLDDVLAETALDLPPITLAYRPSLSPEDDLEAVEQALAEVLERECRQRQALIGPHRDELVFSWHGRPLKRVASAGERKAFGLLLVAAQARVLHASGVAPSVLLDDADTELDQGRLQSLWPVFEQVGQCFVTSNRESVWTAITFARSWRCEAGRPLVEGP